ncbi:MAG: endonuclease [Hirschia sp.]|nr:endonuclease [Hirschia sp.]MBF17064.1 endonuclease [Hirschia sp.]|tara:strand:+ start:391 stop:744 length:354 start_codon:yes stop_codon:yes gene_type:complete
MFFFVGRYFTYMLASACNGTLYVGVTNDLERRVWEHRNGYIKGFTSRYGVCRLVWFEVHDDISETILREKRIKRWRRDWKKALIEEDNPHWADLYPDLVPGESAAPERLSARRPSQG